MIQQETLTLQWIETVSKSNRKADKILVEKVIRALLPQGIQRKPNMDFVKC